MLCFGYSGAKVADELYRNFKLSSLCAYLIETGAPLRVV